MLGKRTTRPFRTEQELRQPYDINQTFTHVATTNDSELVILVRMEEGNKISIMVDFHDAYIAFDSDIIEEEKALLIPAGQAYNDDNVGIIERITMKNAKPNKNARVRGILWGR